MKDLQEATEKICDLKGSMLALEAMLASLIRVLPSDAIPALTAEFEQQCEAAQTVLLNGLVSEHTRTAFERDAQRMSANFPAMP